LNWLLSAGVGYGGTQSNFQPGDITPMDLAGALDLFMLMDGTSDYNMDDILNLLDNSTS
jgi:hypothetical protein